MSATPDARPPAPPGGRSRALIVLVLLAGAGAAFWFLRGDEAAPTARYRTQALEKRTVIRRVEASGHLTTGKNVEVPALLAGMLRSMDKKAGEVVKAGDQLARLDLLPSSINIDQLQAAAGTQALAVKQAELAENAAKEALERARPLRDKNIISEDEIRKLESAVAAARGNVRIAQQQAAGAGQAVKGARRLEALSTLVAPIDGVVVSVKEDLGRMVGPTTGPVFVLADTLDRLVLDAEVSELDVALLKPGQEAEILVDALPGEKFPGRVIDVGITPARSGSLVTYPVKFELDNPGQRLRPGYSATARVEADRAVDALAVPEAALRYAPPDTPPADDRSRVFRVGKAGEAEAVPVNPGLSDGAFTVVTADPKGPPLAAGDAIIIGQAKGDEPAAKGGINLSGKK